MEHSWGAQFELWGPIHQEAGQLLDLETHLSLREYPSCLWPCTPHREKSSGNKQRVSRHSPPHALIKNPAAF